MNILTEQVLGALKNEKSLRLEEIKARVERNRGVPVDHEILVMTVTSLCLAQKVQRDRTSLGASPTFTITETLND